MRDMWDQRYAEPSFAYGETPNDFLREVAGQLPAGRVLCLGEGEGRNAVYLAERGHEVLAVDASQVGLDKTLQLARLRGVEVAVEQADLADYEIAPGRWAGIVSIFCHVPPPIRERIHRASVGGLAPGGAFILEAYAPAQLEHRTGGPPSLPLLFELAVLRKELSGLDLEHAVEAKREIHEGKYHHGLGAVVQIVGRKPAA